VPNPRLLHFAALKYSQLTHSYPADLFDVVIGSGVLEHVPIDSESRKELYRVIRPDGYFVMTMLPNRYSYTEFLNRVVHTLAISGAIRWRRLVTLSSTTDFCRSTLDITK
jgi:2-polyprenyl-3-methyl-5-hydroxy-6-metoxy-1,4-benzoquinol methylase